MVNLFSPSVESTLIGRVRQGSQGYGVGESAALASVTAEVSADGGWSALLGVVGGSMDLLTSPPLLLTKYRRGGCSK